MILSFAVGSECAFGCVDYITRKNPPFFKVDRNKMADATMIELSTLFIVVNIIIIT